MFPKSQRIAKSKEIQKALKAPVRGSCLFGQILLSSNPAKIQNTKVKRFGLSNLASQNLNSSDPLNLKLLKSFRPSQPNESNLNLENRSETNLSNSNGKIMLQLEINQTEKQNKYQQGIKDLPKAKEVLAQTRPKTKPKTELSTNLKQPEFRLLCVVSKKIHKKANQRNKIRRRILAIFADLKAKKRLPPNVDCVIIIRSKEILTATFAQYQQVFVSAVASLYHRNFKKRIS